MPKSEWQPDREPAEHFIIATLFGLMLIVGLLMGVRNLVFMVAMFFVQSMMDGWETVHDQRLGRMHPGRRRPRRLNGLNGAALICFGVSVGALIAIAFEVHAFTTSAGWKDPSWTECALMYGPATLGVILDGLDRMRTPGVRRPPSEMDHEESSATPQPHGGGEI